MRTLTNIEFGRGGVNKQTNKPWDLEERRGSGLHVFAREWDNNRASERASKQADPQCGIFFSSGTGIWGDDSKTCEFVD